MQRYEDFRKSPYFFCLFNILTLTHLVLRVLLVDNKQASLTADNLAVRGTLL